MNYSSITKSTVIPAFKKIQPLQLPQNTTWCDREIKARVAYFGLVIPGILAPVVDTIIGLASLIGAFLTLGMCPSINNFAFTHLSTSTHVASLPYRFLLHVINPRADFPRHAAICASNGLGFLTGFLQTPLVTFANNQTNSPNWIKRHVASRLCYSVLAVVAIVTRIADAVIATIAIPLSLITGGTFGSLNNLADRASEAPALIYDLADCILMIINPHSS